MLGKLRSIFFTLTNIIMQDLIVHAPRHFARLLETQKDVPNFISYYTLISCKINGNLLSF